MTVTTANPPIELQNTDSAAADENIFSAATDDVRRANNDPRQQQPRQNKQPRRDKRDVHGWVALDKPIGMTSTHADRLVECDPAVDVAVCGAGAACSVSVA